MSEIKFGLIAMNHVVCAMLSQITVKLLVFVIIWILSLLWALAPAPSLSTFKAFDCL